MRRMRALVLPFVAACSQAVHLAEPVPETDPGPAWAELLERSSDDGLVDYAAIEAERSTLETYLAWVGVHGPELDDMRESKEDRRLAFLLNATNAAMIHAVLRSQPLDTVQSVKFGLYQWSGAGFFHGLRYQVDGQWQSLAELEVQALLGRYQEPLLHFAIACPAVDCPPVRWWEEKTLKRTLTQQARNWLDTDEALRKVDGVWQAHPMLVDHAKDFTDWSEHETACAFLAERTFRERKAWLTDQSAECAWTAFEPDWTLNRLP